LVTTAFFEHESCGKCTPCREGTWWAVKVLERIERGEGRPEDMDLLLDIADGIDGRSFCPLGDAASWALRSNVKLFREEFEQHVAEQGCPFDHENRTLVGAMSGGSVHREKGGVGVGAAGIGPQPSAGIDVDTEGGEGSPGSRN
jgi:NADH-ubiquinone oxidoreductase-F iron-sulfur binding region